MKRYRCLPTSARIRLVGVRYRKAPVRHSGKGTVARAAKKVSGRVREKRQTAYDLLTHEHSLSHNLREDSASGFGGLTAVRHCAMMAETASRWLEPPMPLGSHAPEWPR
jgi:hypothetical protein